MLISSIFKIHVFKFIRKTYCIKDSNLETKESLEEKLDTKFIGAGVQGMEKLEDRDEEEEEEDEGVPVTGRVFGWKRGDFGTW